MKLNYFNFKKMENQIMMTNDFGNFLFVSESEFKDILHGKIEPNSDIEKKLLDHKMIYRESDLEFSSTYMYDIRSLKQHVNMATSLHIFVVTTACNMNCVYCQANNGKKCSDLYMTADIAKKAVDIALESPTRYLTFEFQGGEPLLNFDIVKYIVEYTEEKNESHVINFNIVTNLTLFTEEMIEFFKEHKFGISTSLDGPEILHNKNRAFRNGQGTYAKVVESLQKLRAAGLYVGAIETTTRESLLYPKELARTYAKLGFESIFVRPLTPLGKATVNWEEIGYTPEEFIKFYKSVMMELIQINLEGSYIKEDHTAILLNRICGDFVNYMELRSPCGAGIGQLAYYADGNIFTCDEGRMVYEMGDATFCLGNVFESNYQNVINNGVCRTVCASSMLETLPSCCDCVYQPYCGTCPVVNYAGSADVIEKSPRGYRCKIYTGILDFIFEQFLKDEKIIMNVFDKWRC